MPQRCVGPGSWAWRCPERSACSPLCLWPAPAASSAAPLSSGPPYASPPPPWETRSKRAVRPGSCSKTGDCLILNIRSFGHVLTHQSKQDVEQNKQPRLVLSPQSLCVFLSSHSYSVLNRVSLFFFVSRLLRLYDLWGCIQSDSLVVTMWSTQLDTTSEQHKKREIQLKWLGTQRERRTHRMTEKHVCSN